MVRQRHPGDCGLACLATLLEASHTYEDVEAAAALLDPKWRGSRGMRVRDLPRVARTLGLVLERRRRLALDTDCGVVVVHGPHFSRDGHYVAVRGGRVLDPGTGAQLRWRQYQKLYAARFTTLLALPRRRGLGLLPVTAAAA